MLAEPLKPIAGIERLVEPLTRHGKRELKAKIAVKGVPLYTDARHYSAAGIPTVLYGAGPRSILEANAHGADEKAGGGHRVGHGAIRSGGEDVRVMNDQALEDRDDLRGGLAETEDGLRRAASERAVMVDLRESQIFERQRAKLRDRRVDVDTPGCGDLRAARAALPYPPFAFDFRFSNRFALPDWKPARSSVHVDVAELAQARHDRVVAVALPERGHLGSGRISRRARRSW